MAVIRLFLCGFLALLLCGCGQTVSETLHIPEGSSAEYVCAGEKTIVVLPFADYSYADDLASVYNRNIAVTESLIDQLVAKGMRVPVQEDVFRFLVDSEIINLYSYGDGKSFSTTNRLERELENDWSDMMKEEFADLIAVEQSRLSKHKKGNPLAAPGTHGLDRRSVARIGKAFDADYLVRGRIIAYDLQNENTWDPRKRGLLPFVFGASSKTLFGTAKSEEYDNLNAMAIGGMAGALIGNNLTTPFEPEADPTTIVTATSTTTISPTNGTSDYATLNSLTWGLAGAGAAHLASKGGKTPQAVVHLRVWIQDTSSGEVVWTNRAEVKVSPESTFADSNSAALFSTAVDRAVAALVDDFWAKTKANL
jgi:hypothetical protein